MFQLDYTGPHFLISERSGKKKMDKIVKNFRPYFYADATEKIPDDASIIEVVESDRLGLRGEKLNKIVLKHPKNTERIRNLFRNHFEANIPYLDRFVLDWVKETSIDARVCFLDIESSGKYPGILDKKNEIYCISCADSWDSTEIITFAEDNETDMLNQFADWFCGKQFDAISGWNLENYDMVRINDRLGSSELSPVKQEHHGRPIGISILDTQKLYKHFSTLNLESYALNYVSKVELNDQKKEIDWTQFDELWKSEVGRDKIIEYNKHDVKLLVDIDEKRTLNNNFLWLHKLSLVRLENLWSNSKVIDLMLLRHSERALPTFSRAKQADVGGALVLDSMEGLHKDVIVADVASMYPNIMRNFNISPETVDPNGSIVAPNGVSFTSDKQGLVAGFVENLLELKSHYKGTDAYDAVKGLVNSVYGVLAFDKFRLYDPECADAITSVGRKILECIEQHLVSQKVSVLGGDTDSIFVSGCTDEEIGGAFRYAESVMSDYGSPMKLEYSIDKYPRFMIFARKRYVALTESDIILAKGVQMKRRDSPPILREIQGEMFRLALHDSSTKIPDLLKREWKRFEAAPLIEIASPRGLSKQIKDYKRTDPWIRGALASNKLFNRKFTGPGLVRIVYLVGTPKELAIEPGDEELLESRDLTVDTEFMWKKFIIPRAKEIRDLCIAKKTLDDFI